MNTTDNIDIKVLDLTEYAFVVTVTMDGVADIHGSVERDDVIAALENLVTTMKQRH